MLWLLVLFSQRRNLRGKNTSLLCSVIGPHFCLLIALHRLSIPPPPSFRKKVFLLIFLFFGHQTRVLDIREV